MNNKMLPYALGAGMVVMLAAFRPDVGTAARPAGGGRMSRVFGPGHP